ncbi:UNVERIFIED_CONTAM: hypothetical protein FKN15_015240 [Acipenser sinensis]
MQVMYPAIFDQLLLFVEFSCKPPQYGKLETKHVANAKYNQSVFTLLLGPFAFFNAQKTKYLQIITSLMRWIVLYMDVVVLKLNIFVFLKDVLGSGQGATLSHALTQWGATGAYPKSCMCGPLCTVLPQYPTAPL